jgi:hypothetical protein
MTFEVKELIRNRKWKIGNRNGRRDIEYEKLQMNGTES